jgi:tetratricopeptide (TPR) repeat protein
VGSILKRQDQLNEAVNYYKKSLEMLNRIYKNGDHPCIAASLNNLGLLYDQIGQNDHALSYFNQSLDMRMKILSTSEVDGTAQVAQACANDAAKPAGRVEKLIDSLRHSLDIRKKLFGQEQAISGGWSIYSKKPQLDFKKIEDKKD